MVNFRDSIAVCNSTNMANSWSSTDLSTNSKQSQRNRKHPIPSKPSQSNNRPFCERSRTGVIDVLYFIGLVSAFGFLIFPSLVLLFNGFISICGSTFSMVMYEVYRAPMVYLFIGVSLFFATLAALMAYTSLNNTCGIPNCRGLRKTPEFDIQVETEDSLMHSTSYVIEGAGKGGFRLSQDHHRELEAELKKLAPPNGRAVLLFRASCGCPVGRMEVPGPKKLRKVKK